MKKRRTMNILIVVLGVLLAGCPMTPRDESPSAGGITSGGFEENANLFVENAASPGTFTFLTNSSAHWSPYGYTLWTLKGTGQTPFVSKDVSLNKMSGNDTAGYGTVFCHYQSSDPAVGETMLVVMINTRKEYIVGEVKKTDFTPLIAWTQSTNLKGGYNQDNRILLKRNNGTGEFTLTINGTIETTFTDDKAPYHTGGAEGYLVVTSPLDTFPGTAVEVIFTEH